MKTKYDRIGTHYDHTRRADRFIAERLLYHLSPVKDGIYLDIGCGTGNYTNEFQKRGFRFIGIDPSGEMLAAAERKNDRISWRVGTAEKTNLVAESMDGITGSLTIHHWSDLRNGFSELNRILKENRRIVVFTSTPEQMKGYWLNHYFPQMLKDSMRQMPSYTKVIEAMTGSGFEMIGTEKYFVQPGLTDHFLYCGKTRPELYLRDDIRYGISSFSDLAGQQEIRKGLIQLRSDIDSGKIQMIIDEYDNDEGDYLFIIGKKAGEG
jgi:ubiquinone/menaquinone biosynthesis C-methylase UbiE